MGLDIRIATGSSVPIYRQIRDQVCHAVAVGKLAEGEQIPSVRALAEQILVNPNTVARTYADLIRDGVLEAQKGRGVFVARRRAVYTQAERQRRLEGPLDALFSEALALGFSAEEIRGAFEQKLRKLELAQPGNGEGQRGNGGK